MSKSRQGGSEASRVRLEEMITVVQLYRGWTQRQVAEALNRNVHALVPDSGNPKLDLVVKLSSILDWPIEMVVSDLREAELDAARGERAAKGGGAASDSGPMVLDPESPDPRSIDPKTLIRQAWEGCEAERWDDVLGLTEPERLEGLDGESRGWMMYYRQVALESRGQYIAAIECCQTGLEAVGHESEAAWRLRTALAYLLLVIGSVTEADGVSLAVISELSALPRSSPRRERLAFAHYVRGLSRRLLALRGSEASSALLDQAQAHLREASEILDDYGAYGGSARNAAVARTARCVAREIDVLAGRLPPVEIVDEVLSSLDCGTAVTSLDSNEAESIGWRCIIAARVVLAFPEKVVNPERVLAILTNKADEVAERLGHWGLRERLFAIEHLHRVLVEATGEDVPSWNLDEQDVRTLLGTMGRFPRFRRIGWKILAAARQERREGES
ncbi:MAG TPA: hypothetical protein PKC43_14535 [Phycisphaerales bacterium]|nr:hypothetical protein [Phycisphaerales bacterium]HMP38652.1 hypothetical protein [Phycisphaerales bacterium]